MLFRSGKLFGQTPPYLENDVRNVLSQQANTAWPPPPPSLTVDARTVTPNQFKSGTVVGGWQTTRIYTRGVAIANAGFELPIVSADSWTTAPSVADSSWKFTGSAGIARQSTWFSTPTPSGLQAVFLQQGGSIEQTVAVTGGTYTLSFRAICRSGYDQSGLTVSLAGTQVASCAATDILTTDWKTFTYTVTVATTARSASIILALVLASVAWMRSRAAASRGFTAAPGALGVDSDGSGAGDAGTAAGVLFLPVKRSKKPMAPVKPAPRKKATDFGAGRKLEVLNHGWTRMNTDTNPRSLISARSPSGEINHEWTPRDTKA